MPSTLVHVALAGLIGCALLGAAFSPRAILVVMAATAAIDLDTFLGWVVLGAHRSALHTLLLPAALAGVLYWDVRVRESSWLLARFGGTAPRVASVSIVAVVFAGIGADMMFNGVNAFWPIHDQFYEVTGKLYVSDQEGLVQTFFEPAESGDGGSSAALGSSQERQYYTGADTNPGQEANPEPKERIFPLANSGTELLLVLTGLVVVGGRLVEDVRGTENR